MNTRLLIHSGLILGLCAASPFAQSAPKPERVPSTYNETVSSATLYKGSTLMGLELRALERDALCATVKDALIEEDGSLSALVVSTEEGPDGLVILPIDVVSLHGEADTDEDAPRKAVHPVKSGVLKVDAERLNEAPRLVGDDREGDVSRARWMESAAYFEIESHADDERMNKDEAHAKPFHRASTLIDHEVVGHANESLGEIADFAFAHENDSVRYVVLECGGVMGLGEKQFAVPFSALEQVRIDDERALRVPVSTEDLEDRDGFERWPSSANDTLFAKADDEASKRES